MKKTLAEWWVGKEATPSVEVPKEPTIEVEVEIEVGEKEEEQKELFPIILKASTYSNLITIMLNSAATIEDADIKDLKEKTMKYIEILTNLIGKL